MPSPRPQFSTLEFPSECPAWQREVSARPTHQPVYNIRRSDGFLPLGVSKSLPILNDCMNYLPATDYFISPDIEKALKVHAVTAGPHEMVLLESSTIESQEKTGVGFALPVPSEDIEQENECISLGPHEQNSSSSSPEPPFSGYISTSDIPIGELTHPTGSLLIERDMLPSVSICLKQGLDPMPQLRGGSVPETDLYGQELEVIGNYNSIAALD
jgi:hypothetical protein